MKRIILASVLCLSLTSLAQNNSQQPPRLPDEEIQALFQSLSAQRDRANNEAAQMAAKVQVLTLEVERYRKENEALKDKTNTLPKPPPAK